MRSRWGGFAKGRKLISSFWEDFRVDEYQHIATKDINKPSDFDYTTSQGIWDLNSTTLFRKTTNVSQYELGLSSSLFSVSGQNNAWVMRTVDVSGYAGATVRLVYNYKNGSSYIGDLQLDQIDLDGNVYSFDSSVESFETSTTNTASYSSVSWIGVTTATTTARWNRDTGGTPSTGTGRTDAASGAYYLYAETSSPADVSGYNFWLRSPQVTLGDNPTLSFYEARYGTGIGTLNVYLDVIA